MTQINTKEQFMEFAILNWNAINAYIDQLLPLKVAPLYTSVDIREAANKIAPVDNNQYPAGFNNICDKDTDYTSRVLKRFWEEHEVTDSTIGIIPESHARNLFYLDHLAALRAIFQNAGKEVIFLSPDEEFITEGTSLKLTSHSGHEIEIFKASVNQEGWLQLTSGPRTTFSCVVLNHDQSHPLPIDWKTLKTQVYPSGLMGWYRRHKNLHFQLYQQVVNQFCEHFSINPDLIQAKFRAIDQIDFQAKSGLEKLATSFQSLQEEIGHSKAKIFLKASQGTYGMGISVVESADEILNMNRKMRNKMDVGKNNLKFQHVLLQEGVETIITHEGKPAEITLYLIGGRPVGGFMRTNALRDSLSNLNSKGMAYEKFCICEIKEGNTRQGKLAAYGVIARLSTLATALETKEMEHVQ